jgi:hypothetical protein
LSHLAKVVVVVVVEVVDVDKVVLVVEGVLKVVVAPATVVVVAPEARVVVVAPARIVVVVPAKVVVAPAGNVVVVPPTTHPEFEDIVEQNNPLLPIDGSFVFMQIEVIFWDPTLVGRGALLDMVLPFSKDAPVTLMSWEATVTYIS